MTPHPTHHTPHTSLESTPSISLIVRLGLVFPPSAPASWEIARRPDLYSMDPVVLVSQAGQGGEGDAQRDVAQREDGWEGSGVGGGGEGPGLARGEGDVSGWTGFGRQEIKTTSNQRLGRGQEVTQRQTKRDGLRRSTSHRVWIAI
jgi:hypothetical protein